MKAVRTLMTIGTAGMLVFAGAWLAHLSAGEPVVAVPRNSYPAPVEIFEKTHRVVFDKLDHLINQAYERLNPTVLHPDWRKIIREATDKANKMPDYSMPMRILPDVYVVAGGNSYQRIYVVDCGNDFLLIDDGDHRTREELLESLRHLGFPTPVPKWVFVTHCHYDHALNSRLFQEMGSEIMIHRDDAPALATVNQRTAAYGIVPRGVEFRPCKADRLLDDGDVLRLGNKTFYVFHAPGHTAGCVCLVLQHDGKNILFSGDVAWFNGRLGYMGYPFGLFREYKESARKLLHLKVEGRPITVDALLPGHSTMVLSGGEEHLRRLALNVEWVLPAREAEQLVDPKASYWDSAWKAYRKTMK